METTGALLIDKAYIIANIARCGFSFIATYFFSVLGAPFIAISLFGAVAALSLLWLLLTATGILDESRYIGAGYLPAFFDLMSLSGVIYLTGTVQSFAVIGYILLVTLSSLNLVIRQGIFSALGAIVLYSALCILVYAGYLPPVNIFQGHSGGPLINLVLAVTFFAFVAANIHLTVNRILRDLHDERQRLGVQNHAMQNDLAMARRIQQQLIPARSPAPYIHSLYRPIESIGGDFFDFFRFRDSDDIGIFIGDVSGHGVTAAFITSIIKSTLLQSAEKRRDPAALLSHLNAIMTNRTGGNFVTAFYCVLQPAVRRITYANAGHYPPYLIGNGDPRLLPGRGSPPLAAFRNDELAHMDRTYQNHEFDLAEYRKLLLYTDGIIEAQRYADTPGFERLMATIGSLCRELSDTPCREFAGLFLERLLGAMGDYLDDDVCLICVDLDESCA